MATNPHFNSNSVGVATEQSLYENLVIESLKIYGQDMTYVPRDEVELDRLFGEDIASSFTTSYDIEMYVENSEGYEGADLFQKFGIEIRDETTLVVSRSRWNTVVGTPHSQTRPNEGDLIYVPFSKTIFEITMVEHEEPFYALVHLPVYKLRCAVFEYNGEDLDIDGVDTSEMESDYAQVLTVASAGAFTIGETITQTHSGTVVTGELVSMSGADLVVSHVTSSSGEFQMFVSGIDITGDESTVTRSVTAVADWTDNNTNEYELNDDFDLDSEGVIADSSNPYGVDY